MAESKGATKANTAWLALEADMGLLADIAAHGFVDIKADAIKRYYEPRLATKFDDEVSRPAFFKDNRLTIFSLENGLYRIVRANLYVPLDFREVPVETLMPLLLETLDVNALRTEQEAMHAAHYGGLFTRLTGEHHLDFTQNGRSRTGQLVFNITLEQPTAVLPTLVSNAQMELDGGYESDTAFYLVEAKMGLPETLHFRQLYYPHRYWQQRLKGTRKVRSIFMGYSLGLYYAQLLHLADPEDPLSWQVERSACYTFQRTELTNDDLAVWLKAKQYTPDTAIPFPQADSLPRTLALLERVKLAPLGKAEYAEEQNFDKRQADYYMNAAAFMGFLQRPHGSPSRATLTPLGEKLFARPMQYQQRQRLVQQVLSLPVFQQVYRHYYQTGEWMSRADVMPLIDAYSLQTGNAANATTQQRRVSTVLSWLRWVDALVQADA